MRARGWALVLCLGVVPLRVGADDTAATQEPEPVAIVQTAFDRLFNYTSARRITMRVLRNGRLVTVRNLDMVYKRVEGQGRTFLRFNEPEYLRETAMLILENPGGRSDAWVYLPELRKPRRYSTGEKRDPFYATDLTLEDLEHHDWRRYQVTRMPDSEIAGRACFAVKAIAPRSSGYAHVLAYVERSRHALLRVEFFSRGSADLLKTLELAPTDLRADRGVLVPSRMSVRLAGRDAWTDVVFDRVDVDPPISDEVFSISLLEKGAKPFDLVHVGNRGGSR
jgi:hypothetical protein